MCAPLSSSGMRFLEVLGRLQPKVIPMYLMGAHDLGYRLGDVNAERV